MALISGTELWHRAPRSWLTPCPSPCPCLSRGRAGPGVSAHPCPSRSPQTLLGRGWCGELRIKAEAAAGWGGMSRQSSSQHLPINQTELRAVASPGNPRPSLTLTELSLPDVASEKQVPDVTCLIIFPFPKDKAPCSSCTEGRVDTCGGSWASLCCDSWRSTLKWLLQEGQLH